MKIMRNILAWLAAAMALGISIPPAQANSGTAPPQCFTNRFGVEQCDNPNANGGAATATATRATRIQSGTQPDVPQARLRRYCDDRRKAGEIDADGICATSANGG